MSVINSNERFPHQDHFKVGRHSVSADQILSTLMPLLTEERLRRMRQVVSGRTFSVTPVLENIYDRGNASAVMRSAEAFGFQSVHMIELGEKFKESQRTTAGADKWLDVVKWRSTQECIQKLKQQNYQIIATSLEDAKPIGEIDFTVPTAIVYGNEKDGVSPEMLKASDHRVIIPMHGFVQSFNISVAAAISLYHIYCARVKALGANGDLSESEQKILLAAFILRSTTQAELLFDRALIG